MSNHFEEASRISKDVLDKVREALLLYFDEESTQTVIGNIQGHLHHGVHQAVILRAGAERETPVSENNVHKKLVDVYYETAGVDPLKQCECRCGYRCGGPGTCGLGMSECLKQEEGHFVQDCDHVWDGPDADVSDGQGLHGSTSTCSICGAWQMSHDMAVGP